MTGYIILGIGIILFVLLLTLITINKGYAYKHTVDELPKEPMDSQLNTDKLKNNALK